MRIAPAPTTERPTAEHLWRTDTPTRTGHVLDPDALTARVEQLAERHPDVARTELVGRSEEGRPITSLVLGARPDDPAVPRVLVTAGVHGRETANAPLVLDWAAELLDRAAAGDAGRAALLRERTVVVVPQVSPDTAAVVGRGLDSGDAAAIWRRTNLDPVAGVDLNRNFPGPSWGTGSSTPGSQNYVGSAPGSEPETQAVLEAARRRRPDAVYDLHSPGGVVLAPTDASGGVADARDAAALVGRATGYAVRTSGEQWAHEVGGTVKDWAHDVLGVPALTIETGAVHHQTDAQYADSRARPLPALDALEATVDGRTPPPAGAEHLARPAPAVPFVAREHLEGVTVGPKPVSPSSGRAPSPASTPTG